MQFDNPTNHTILYPTSHQTRYLQIYASNLFLFDDELLNKILSHMNTLGQRIEFVEKCIKLVNIESFDLVRKFAWTLSSMYFDKSLESQLYNNINQAMFEI